MTRGCGCEGVLRALKQPFSCIGIAKRRQQKVNRGASRIGGSIEIAPATLHLHIRFVDAPRPVSRFEMPSQALVEFRPISLHPPPYGRVINPETALFKQFFYVSQGKASTEGTSARRKESVEDRFAAT
jgi:hypothetical protein